MGEKQTFLFSPGRQTLPMTKIKLISPWRRSFQWVTTLLILLLPWFSIDGESLLRLDIPNLSLYFFGQLLRIEELYLFLFFCLVLVFGFLLITLIFGRVWCGWACPQTTLNDLAEWLARKFGLRIVANRLKGDLWRKAFVHLGYAFLAFLVAANLLWYFIEPQRFFTELFNGELPFVAWLTLLIVFAIVYIDLTLIRRLMCSDFCPYGRIQTSLVDPGTLTLHLPDSEADRCIECGSCVRVCPMGINIRKGYQVECINCGGCLDACRKIMLPRQEQGLICYSFGLEGQGIRALLNLRTLLITTALLGLVVILTIATLNRSTATLKLSHSHLVADRLMEDGRLAIFFNAWINNRMRDDNLYDLEAHDLTSGTPLQLKGQTRNLSVVGGGNRRIDFVLLAAQPDSAEIVKFTLKDRHGKIVDSTEAIISPATSRE